MAVPKVITAKRLFRAASSAADAGDRDGSGSLIDIVAGNASAWSRIMDPVCIKGLAALTGITVARFFKTDGTHNDLVHEEIIGPQTADATHGAWERWVDLSGVILIAATDHLKFSMETNASCVVSGAISDFN